MKRSLMVHLYESYCRVHGHMLALLSVGLAVAAFYLQPADTFQIKWIVLPLLLLIVLIIVLVDLTIHLYTETNRNLPKVRFGNAPPTPYERAVALLLLDPSSLFGQGLIVSVYAKAEELEEFRGIGKVLTIQENGLIQVLVLRDVTNDGSFWDKVRQNDASILKQLMVKPSIPSTYYS